MEIDENASKLLEKDFKRLAKCGPDIPARVLNYVLSGEDDQVLEELANSPNACDLMGMEWGESKERAKFFSLRIDNATLHLRLAKAYDAIVRSKRIFNFFPFGDFHLDAFLYQMAETSPHYSSSYHRKLSLHTDTLVKMFEMVGLNRDELARRAFLSGSVCRHRFTGVLVCLPGFNEYIAEYPEVLKAAFSNSEPNIVSDALEYCKIGSIKPDPYFEELLKIAITSTKKNREIAISLLELSRDAAGLALAERFPSLSLKERQQAPKLIAHLLKDSAEVFRQLAANEKNEKVAASLREYVSGPSEPVRALPRPQVDANAPLSREIFELFNEVFHLSYTIAMDDYNKRTHHSEWRPESISQKKIDKGFELLQSGTAKSCRNLYLMPSCWRDPVKKLTERLILHPEFKLIHLLRLLAMFGDLSLNYPMLFYYQGRGAELIQTFHAAKPFNLFELAANTIAIEMEESRIGMQFIHQECGIELHEPVGFDDADIVDYFSVRTEELERALISRVDNERLTASDLSQRRRNALIILSKFERIPSKFLPHVWDIALGSLKTDKPYAQACIAKVPEFTSRLIASIEDKNQDTRISAVEWLGRIGEKAAIEPISRRYPKEKSDSVKGVFLTALERLGARIERFLNRDALLKEARDGLQKGIPEQLSWIDFAQFPKLYWKDTSEEVTPEITRCLIVQSHKIGSPEPGPLLRRYAQMFSEPERYQLGLKLLEQWIARDTRRFSYEEAAAKVDRMTASWSSSDKEKYYKGLLKEEMMKFKGSAVNERGVLALVAAVADGSVTPLVKRYIYEHRGNRSSQAKSLIQMLSWIDDPQAVQLLLAISSRFGVKGIRDEAELQLAQMAERRGWTSDELADRTIPTAGFDDGIKAELNYGSRAFYAKLTHNLQVQLTDSEDNILKALPEARAEDDPERVKECKKLFSEMKKQIKAVLDTQSIRLYEAMCVQRAWKWSDWDTFLHRHPLVNHLCSRLVWTADGIAFRPLGDGTLTNARDEQVNVSSESLVRIAHIRTTEGAAEWLKHFSDYGITPLFDQFSAEKSYTPQGNSIKEFYGFVADGQALLNLAEKMGYIKAEVDYERFFKDFTKRYSVGLEAVVETSGMHGTVKGVKMERQRVALLQGYFRRVKGKSKPVDLSEVPPVLLAEFYKDMKQFAALAQYDPEWQKHVG